MLATLANMRRIYPRDKSIPKPDGTSITISVAKPFAYSPLTDERYSANPGDYWNLADDEPLTDSEGEPMVLAFERTTIELVED